MHRPWLAGLGWALPGLHTWLSGASCLLPKGISPHPAGARVGCLGQAAEHRPVWKPHPTARPEGGSWAPATWHSRKPPGPTAGLGPPRGGQPGNPDPCDIWAVLRGKESHGPPCPPGGGTEALD